MELNEDLNKQYIKDKKSYENLKQFEEKIKDLKQKHKMQYRKREDALTKKSRAIEDEDKVQEQEADNEIKATTEELKNIKEQINKIKSVIEKSKENVDSYINELSQDPEFKKQIDYILKTRYEGGLKKVEKEKEQADLIIDVCTEHPSLENNLKGMIRAVEELEKIKSERDEIDEERRRLVLPDDQDKLDDLEKQLDDLKSQEKDFNEKRNKNKKSFMSVCEKNNINISEDSLDKIIEEKRFTHDGKDEIQALKSLKRISKGYDKQKASYEKAIGKISGSRNATRTQDLHNSTNNNANIIRGQLPNNSQHAIEQEGTNNEIDDETPEVPNVDEEEQTPQGNNLPDRTYKWYQFRKRFKAWRERRRAQRNNNSPSHEEEPEAEEPAVEENTPYRSEKFKDAYKYDIVKDYVDAKEKEILREAGRQVRRENDNSENER